MAKKRNAQESTDRNDRASMKRDDVLRCRIKRLEDSHRKFKALVLGRVR